MTDDASRQALESTLCSLGIKQGREHGMYAPIAKRCPIRINDDLPLMVKVNLAQHHTCACTDSDVVYVDTRLAGEMFKRASEVANGKKEVTISSWKARENYKTLLVHEYTHIIMQHVEKGIKFVRANGDKNYPIFALACDIEANRGWGIEKDSDLYQIAVSEDSYPECKGVEGLMNIYRVLKKNYGDEILDKYNRLQDEENEDDEDEQEEDEGGENSDVEEEKAETETEAKKPTSAQSQSESSVNMSEEGDAEVEEGEAEAEEGEAEAEAEAREGAMRRAMSSYKQMREEIEQKASMMTEEELDKDVEHFDEETGDGIPLAGGMGDGTGEGTGSAQSPKEILQAGYDAYLNRKIEKAIEKLKNLVKGSQVKTRVKTYSRQSRKEGADGLIRKGVKNEKALAPRILVAMDSSGSMSSTTVTPIAKSIGSIAKSVGKTKGSFICEHDSMVKNVQPLSKWELVVEKYYPMGDNDFDEVLKKAVELNVQVVLDVGDGYCRFFDKDVMAEAVKKGIKWIDVQVTGQEGVLRNIRREDEERFTRHFKQKFMEWEIIKVGEED